jgi:4-hydroxybenzoate polyprenyltransferase
MPRRQPAPDLRTVSDAVIGNWVDIHAPRPLRPWLRLARADRPIGTWLLLLPCWWGVGLAAAQDGPGWFDLWIVAGCALGAVLMRAAGCVWNDITDRHIDASVARTRSRPIPSGQVSVRGGAVFMGGLALAALGILLTFPPMAVALGIGSVALVGVYPFAKRFTWWPQAFLGLAFNWGALLAWAAHGATEVAPALALYAAGIAWTLFYDTIYAHQDREDDALIGVKSTARLLGARTGAWLWGFALAATGLMAAAVWLALPPGLVRAVALAGVAGFAAHLAWQMRRLDIDAPEVCLRLFRTNRDAGMIVAATFGLAAGLRGVGLG